MENYEDKWDGKLSEDHCEGKETKTSGKKV